MTRGDMANVEQRADIFQIPACAWLIVGDIDNIAVHECHIALSRFPGMAARLADIGR